MLKYNINNQTIKASWWNSKIHVGEKLSFDIETALFERGKYPYELKLKEFNDDHLLSNYYGMDFPVVEKNSIISIINPRPENPYQFLELGEKEKDRNVKSISATEIREAMQVGFDIKGAAKAKKKKAKQTAVSARV